MPKKKPSPPPPIPPAAVAEAALPQKLDDCPDCAGQETCEGCLRCDGTGTICGVCGEAPEACPCPRP